MAADPFVQALVLATAGEIAQQLHVDPAKAVSLANDLSVLVSGHAAGRDTTAAIADLSGILVGGAAGKLISDFPSQKANLDRGDAIIAAHIHLDGYPVIVSAEREGMQAAQALGL